ncbi:MAG: PAS domain S-box protein [Treponemataceae bacterium]
MDGKRYTILVVDDVPDDIVILDEILKKEYQVKAVTSGEAALKIARSGNPPDLILLDIIMPEMDGFEVCRALKEDAQGAMIPVIFLTAKVMTADEKLGLELGAVDYIRKPIEPEIVKTRIKTHLEQKDQVLRSSEVRFRRLFETSMDGIMIVDTTTGMVVDANPSMARILGLSQEFFLGKRISEMELLTEMLSQKSSFPELRQQRYIRYKEQPMKTADGRKIFVDFMCNSYKVNNREVMQINIRDITDLVATEHERDDLSAKLTHYLSTSPTITYSLMLKEGTARWQWVSENILTILGYTREEVLAPDWWFTNITAADRARALGAIVELAKKATSDREYRFMKKDRSIIWLHDEMRLVHGDDQESEIVGTLTDISARKKAEEEIHLKSAALEAAANTVVISDRTGTIKWANQAFEDLTGYSRAEAIGTNPTNHNSLDAGSKEAFGKMWETIASGNVWSGELEDRKKSGETYTEEVTVTPVHDIAGNIINFIAIISDITERKKSLERLHALLREKSELLREIHHRVNNNVQVMMSLLHISSEEIADSGLRGKLEDITRRMQTMSIIHQQFYESEDMSHIDFAVYLRQLIESLKSIFPDSSKNLSVACEIGEVFLSLEQAIPAGLIVNELLTNALMFAFTDKRAVGKISATQRLLPGSLEVEVRDNGVGLPENIDPEQAQSLGMLLIRLLASQLNGSVEFRRESGTVAVLRFSL